MRPSSREWEVAKLIAWGSSDKEIAQELSISPETSRTHRKNILHKISGHNSADITRWYFQEVTHISLGLNPRQIKHLAMILFLLVTYSEIIQMPIVRIRSGRAKNAGTELVSVRQIRVKRNEYIVA